jgi:hypothetical protein
VFVRPKTFKAATEARDGGTHRRGTGGLGTVGQALSGGLPSLLGRRQAVITSGTGSEVQTDPGALNMVSLALISQERQSAVL